MWRAVVIVCVFGCGGEKSSSDKREKAPPLRIDVKVPDGTAASFQRCREAVEPVLEKDPDHRAALAHLAECAGLEALIYGTERDRAERAAKAAGELGLEEPGGVALHRARIALGLAHFGQPGAPTAFELHKQLASLPRDPWTVWLEARTYAAADNLGKAADGFSSVRDKLAIGQSSLGDALADDGDIVGGLAAYSAAGQDPWSAVGVALTFTFDDPHDVIANLEILGGPKPPPRLAAYRAVGRAAASLAVCDYERLRDQLRTAVAHPVNEPRFWGSVALLSAATGDFAGAAKARANVRSSSIAIVRDADAALLFAGGDFEKALAATRGKSFEGRLLRAHALLELGRYGQVVEELAPHVKEESGSERNLVGRILLEWGRAMAATPIDRHRVDILEHLARMSRSTIGRYALGRILLELGNIEDATRQLEKVVADEDRSYAYLGYVVLARIRAAAGDRAAARDLLGKALVANPGFELARKALAKIPP